MPGKLLVIQNAVRTFDSQPDTHLPLDEQLCLSGMVTAGCSVGMGRRGRAPYLIELFVIGHCQQDVPGRDPALLVVSCCIAGQLQNLRCGEQRGEHMVTLEHQRIMCILPDPCSQCGEFEQAAAS